MILGFRVSNYRSFRDEVSISFVGSRLDHGSTRPVRVAEVGPALAVLPVTAILGANASGKSNLLRAISYMRNLVVGSAQRGPFDPLDREYFKLDESCRRQPTLMELDFSMSGHRYQYGFELYDNLVTGEWLHTFPHKRAQTLFDREASDFTFGRNLPGPNRAVAEVTRPDVLFLSSAAQSGHSVLTEIYRWFLLDLNFLDVPSRSEPLDSLAHRLRGTVDKTSAMLALADLGVIEPRVELGPADPEFVSSLRQMLERDIPQDVPERDAQIKQIIKNSAPDVPTVKLVHRGARKAVTLPFEDESLGTRAWLVLITYALTSLGRGGVLLVDELDASLHPLLMSEAVRMFQDTESNPKNAQLIFTTHDTTVLAPDTDLKLSRGQFWFTEKDIQGRSTITPLSDYRPRRHENLQKGYLDGRYGGTPRVQSGNARTVIAE